MNYFCNLVGVTCIKLDFNDLMDFIFCFGPVSGVCFMILICFFHPCDLEVMFPGVMIPIWKEALEREITGETN